MLVHHYAYTSRAQFASTRFGSNTRRRFRRHTAPASLGGDAPFVVTGRVVTTARVVSRAARVVLEWFESGVATTSRVVIKGRLVTTAFIVTKARVVNLNNRLVAVLSSGVQRRRAVIPCLVDIRIKLDQPLNPKPVTMMSAAPASISARTIAS